MMTSAHATMAIPMTSQQLWKKQSYPQKMALLRRERGKSVRNSKAHLQTNNKITLILYVTIVLFEFWSFVSEARRTPSISSSGSPESVSEVAEECYESPLKRRTYRESDNGPSKTIEKSRNAQLEKKTVSGTATEKMKINGNACPRLSKCIITLIEPVKSDKETCLEKISDVPRLFTDNPFAKYTLSNVTVKEDDGVFRTEIFLDFEQNDKVKQCDDSRASDDDDSQKPLSAQVIESSDTNFSVASPKIPTLFAANSWTDLPEDPKVSCTFFRNSYYF